MTPSSLPRAVPQRTYILRKDKIHSTNLSTNCYDCAFEAVCADDVAGFGTKEIMTRRRMHLHLIIRRPTGGRRRIRTFPVLCRIPAISLIVCRLWTFVHRQAISRFTPTMDTEEGHLSQVEFCTFSALDRIRGWGLIVWKLSSKTNITWKLKFRRNGLQINQKCDLRLTL